MTDRPDRPNRPQPRAQSYPTSIVVADVGPYGYARLLRHPNRPPTERRLRYAPRPTYAHLRNGKGHRAWEPMELELSAIDLAADRVGAATHVRVVDAPKLPPLPRRRGKLELVGVERAPEGYYYSYRARLRCDCGGGMTMSVASWRGGFTTTGKGHELACPTCRKARKPLEER